MMRGSSALVIWPKLAEPNVVTTPEPPAAKLGSGRPARKLLVRLKASPLICSRCRSVIRKFRVRERSNCQKFGPGTLARFMVLKVPAAGRANAAALIKHAEVGLAHCVLLKIWRGR